MQLQKCVSVVAYIRPLQLPIMRNREQQLIEDVLFMDRQPIRSSKTRISIPVRRNEGAFLAKHTQ